MSWQRTAPPLSMVVVCNRERHRLRWQDGRVDPVDHPDLEAELALVAFGGDEPVCVALHRLWQEAVDDGGFVAEWVEPSHLDAAWHSWLAMALERMRSEGFHEFLRHLPPARAQRMGEFLHRFPRPWIDRAGAEVNQRSLSSGDDAGHDEDRLGGLLARAGANRLRRAFVDAVGGRQLPFGAAALVPLALLVDDGAGSAPSIDGVLTGPGRGVSITVDRRWLHRVWAAGAAVVDGHLVLAIDGDPFDDDGAVASVVVWTDVRPTIATARLAVDDHRWRLLVDRS